MKNHIFIIVMLLAISVFEGYAQRFGQQQIISEEADGVRTVLVADVDGDGLKDVLSASRFSGRLEWFKSIDGMGSFGPSNLIAILEENSSLNAADLDGDGDVDVIGTNSFTDVVIWYENVDGSGNFLLRQVLNDSAVGAFSTFIADLDGDGDLDVISASDSSGLAWYENLDGQGTFSPQNVIVVIPNSRSVAAADIDGDNDLDIVSSRSGAVIVSWFENLDGEGTFGSENPIGVPPEPFSTLSVLL